MHIVTKILMVFCAILSLLLAALTMAYASNAETLRASVKSEQELRLAALSETKSAVTNAGTEREKSEKERQSLQAELTDARSKLADQQATLSNLRSELEQSRSKATAVEAQISQLGATTKTQASLIDNYRTEVTTVRETLLTQQKREIELTDRVNELEGVREVLEQNSRALKEQLQEAKLQMQSAQANGSTGNSSTQVSTAAMKAMPTELPGPIVRARVVETFRSPAGEDMVVINEGGNRGIKENTQMNIVRGDSTFVASVVITAVEPTRSVGRITLLSSPSSTVSQNDTVLSRLQ